MTEVAAAAAEQLRDRGAKATLRLKGTAPGSNVKVDGREHELAPDGTIPGLAIGAHLVTVTGRDTKPLQVWVILPKAGETEIVVAQEARYPRIAVLDPKVDAGADPGLAKQIATRVAQVLGKRPGVTVMTAEGIRAMLEHDATMQMMGCDDQSCMAEIAGGLGVNLVVFGRLSKADKGYALSLSAVEAEIAQPLADITETWGGEELGLLDLAETMVTRLFEQGATGRLEVVNALTGSQILVDDQLRASVPAGEITGLTIGAHRVWIVLEGMIPYEAWVIIKADELASLAADQKEVPADPIYTRWWFWTVAGVVVAGGTAAGIGAAMMGGSESSGVTIAIGSGDAFGGSR